MSHGERMALRELSQLPNTIIKPADKGGSIVLWPEHLYLIEAQRQLSNTNHYSPINHNPIPALVLNISEYLHQLLADKIIDLPTYKYLLPNSPSRTPLFYMLPKIHKPNIPGRPIISGCDSPTEKLSIFVDHFLKQFVPFIPSHIKDTNDFLRTILSIPSPLPPGALLVTIDVISLYTNIPQDEGINASLNVVSLIPTHLRPPLHVFRKFLEFILKQNFFLFNDQHYLQILGTAMGTRMAPSFANLFLHQLEYNILSNTPNDLHPLIWKRYIDDVFMIWTHGEQTLLELLQYMNTFHPTIKFQFSFSPTDINFLDTTIYLTPERKLESTLYTKPTDSSMLLHYTSHHPRQCKSGTIYSQALRFRRIITDNNKLCQKLLRLKLILLSRGYPNSLINHNFSKILHLTQFQLLHNPSHKETHIHKQVLPFIVPYHPTLHSIPSILHHFWFLISKDPELSRIFPHSPTTAYSRHSNLKDTLVHTRFTSTSNTHIPNC